LLWEFDLSMHRKPIPTVVNIGFDKTTEEIT